MNIVVFGHQNWGKKAIEVLKDDHTILRVYTHPLDMDKHEKVWYPSLTDICKKYKIPIFERSKISEGDVKEISSMNIDLIVSAGWRKLISKKVINVAKHGAINIHDGLLPKYRGFAPINWAIINGEQEAGVTVHFIDETADTGNILVQKKVSINITDSAKTVYEKLLDFTPEIITKAINLIQANERGITQNIEKGFFCARRFPEDGKINWNENRKKIYDQIRALSDPYPNAFCYYNGKKIFIKKAKLCEDDFRGLPGRICKVSEKGVVVTCGSQHYQNQAILITEISDHNQNIQPNKIFDKLWQKLE